MKQEKNLKKDLGIFLRKVIILLVIPTIIIVGSYLWLDPFKVIYNYTNYYENTYGVDLNRDFISTQKFLNSYKQHKYTAYIVGNSRSRVYDINHWAAAIGKQSKECYHFDAYAESLSGIERKLALLDRRNQIIDQVLMIIDNEVLLNKNYETEAIFTKHPELTGQNFLDFQVTFFKAFGNPQFLSTYIPSLLHRKQKSWNYDTITNELSLVNTEALIDHKTDSFYAVIADQFPKERSANNESLPHIQKEQQILFENMKVIFSKHHTDIKIVINPMYDQVKLNAKDLIYLQETFGAKNVFDFSGKNGMTEDYHNYYDGKHYRTKIADKIVEQIYQIKSDEKP